MAVIKFYTINEEEGGFDLDVINHSGSALGWIVENIKQGENFEVYDGEINKQNEIKDKVDRVFNAPEVSVFILPADAVTAAYLIIAVIAVAVLTPKIKSLSNVNRQQQSPNNNLSNRNNQVRINQRIVDICGKVKSIPDVLQGEFARYVDNIEERIGYYCVARNQVLIEDVKDGDSLIDDIEGASAGVYIPFTSPNNSAPHIQIGDPINEPVVGVFQSSDAIGQALQAPNEDVSILDGEIYVNSTGFIEDKSDTYDFTGNFVVGDNVDIVNVYASDINQDFSQVGGDTHAVTAVEKSKITFDIAGDSSWGNIEDGESIINPRTEDSFIAKIESKTVGPFKLTSLKIDRLLVNVYAPGGMFKENTKGRQLTSVDYIVYYQKLDDNFNPVGVKTPVSSIISGKNSNEKGFTTDIDLGGLTFVEWSLERITKLDYDFDGNIADEIKLKDVFGLLSIDKTDFGNITTIQTRRTAIAQTTAIKNPELNCVATELVNKYESGVFSPSLTPNEQGIQSLIRLALDPFVGRRKESELDLELLVFTQSEIETYFDNTDAGSFSYSFDSTLTSAQETFFSIGAAIYTSLWREGRVLKSLFEKPQSIPSMVFTHRSKQPNAETWNRKKRSNESKDSVEFVYTDDKLYTKETLYFPADRSGKNPERVEMPGVKGLSQATWHMMRIYNKLLYQEITVDFGATSEGRFVRPKKIISVVKGSRVATYDGYISSIDGLLVTLSQDVLFIPSDDHFIILKNKDGSTESVLVTETANKRIVQLGTLPTESIYTGNDRLKTEFSFGNEARLSGQLMIPESISPSDNKYVKIKAVNYSNLYYKDDTVQPVGNAFDGGFSDGFS